MQKRQRQRQGTSNTRQKHISIFVKFVQIFHWGHAIIIPVKPPNTLYSFCYTPKEKYLL